MDKLVPESADRVVLIEKRCLSVSSNNDVLGRNGDSVLETALDHENIEAKLDTSSKLVAESLPDSVSEVFIPSSSQASGGIESSLSKIVLIGTAHVSEKSITEVKATIRNLKPDVVAVELCKGRFDDLEGKSQEEEVPIKDMLSGGKIYYYIIHWLLANLQRKIGRDMGIKPGAEMLSAMEEAESIGAKVALIDRDIQVTLQRFWGMMKFREKIRMFGSLLSGILGIGKEEDIDIDQITEPDFVAELVGELRSIAPTAAKVLIDERDAYLAGNIIRATENGNKTVVAVIGAGHKPGVIDYLKNPKSIPSLNNLTEIPKKNYGIGKTISFLFVGLIVAFFLLLLLSGISLKLFLIAFVCWFIIQGAMSALGAFLAGGHRYSIITSFFIAWITCPHPGWFAGLVEAKQRNPKVSDMKALFAVEKFSDIFKNRIMRVLLVVSLVNIGSLIGVFLGVHIIMQVTGIDPRDILLASLRVIGL